MADTNLNFTESTSPALTVKLVGFSSTAPGAELTITLNTLLNLVRGNVKIDDLIAGDDNTDLNASVLRHGLLPKLGGGTTNFLRADGQWAAPPGEGGSGTPGADGDKGWSPILSVVTDGTRRVLQIVDWTGGEGTKPSTTNQFIGASGIVSTAAAAVDVRGPAGSAGSGSGDMLAANNLSELTNQATARTNLGLGSAATQASSAFTAASHASDTGNPHSVTKAQVGLANADNTSDANKPVSTAQQTALDAKAGLVAPQFTGFSSGGAPSSSLMDTGVPNYIKRTNTSAGTGVTLAEHIEYITNAFTNQNVGSGLLVDLINTGNASGGVGHLIGLIGRARDTTVGAMPLYGVEGKIVRYSTSQNGGAAVWGISQAIGETFTGRSIDVISGFAEIVTTEAATTPVNQGAVIVFRAYSGTGGDPALKFALVGDSGMKIVTGGSITSRSLSNAGGTTIAHDGTDGTVSTDNGRLKLQGVLGNYVPAGSSSDIARIGGRIGIIFSPVGNVGTGEDTLMSKTIKGNTLLNNGDSLKIKAVFNFANNTNNKTIKIYLGASLFYMLGPAGIQNGNIIFEIEIVRLTQTNQLAYMSVYVEGTSLTLLQAKVIPGLTENLAADLLLKFTGEATSNNDLSQLLMDVHLAPAVQ